MTFVETLGALLDAIHWLDWFSLVVRWFHVITAIAWIGSSFYFIWLDLSLKRDDSTLPDNVFGESWSVHGGGFYQVRKFLVAPDKLPKTLHWFKYESYFTWLSGFALLAVIYYAGAEVFLIDERVLVLEPYQSIMVSLACLAGGWIVYDGICRSPLGERTGIAALAVGLLIVGATWLFSEIFSARAALLHTGAMIGTIMTGNVFFIIIPNQKKTVASMQAGDSPDPNLGKVSKLRSTHNNYLTLPVVLAMLGSHFPFLYQQETLWFTAAMIMAVGGLARHYFNSTHAGIPGKRVFWVWPAAAVLFFVMIGTLAYGTVSRQTGTSESGEVLAGVSDQEVLVLMARNCTVCHAERPRHPDHTEAPKNLRFEGLKDFRRAGDLVRGQVVDAQVMPPLGSGVMLTDAERGMIAAWLRQQGK